MQVSKTQSFGARLVGYDLQDLASKSVKNGMSKKYVQRMMEKVHQLFPGKEFFVEFDYHNGLIGEKRPLINNCQVVYSLVTVERKNPKDWDPRKSIWKQILWPTYKDQRIGNEVADNEMVAFYQAVKKLAQKDWSFEKNAVGGENAEKIWLA